MADLVAHEDAFTFDFCNDNGEFIMTVDVMNALEARSRMTRREAEELMFQMADVLGWKAGT